MTWGGGGGGGAQRLPLQISAKGPQNLAHTSEIMQRERPQCYFSQKLHILLVMISYANYMHK